MTKRVVFFLLLISKISFAQFSYVVDQTIPVTDLEGAGLMMPWGGGLNASQYNTMDLNGDGKEDLVLFDRMADKVITFLSLDGEYQYAPAFEILFPNDITKWMLLRDYNCDGKKDIFTGHSFGIKVYTNTTEQGENLSWKHFLFTTGPSGSKSEVLRTQGVSAEKINLQLMFDDLPAIADADGDGDIDIFAMNFGGGSVEFHQNLSAENGWDCDSLDFKRITQNWGNFKECHCGEFAFNGEECASGGRTKHISGKTLAVFDANGDLEMDLVFSEGECNRLFLLQNEGTLLNPIINSFSDFPSSHSVDIEIFPAAFFEDVDLDGIKDLIATPNLFHKETAGINLRQSQWFYKNVGSNEAPAFDFVQNDFLQKHMIDIGDNAKPAFIDFDGDGDRDMFISTNSSDNTASRIFLYENLGSKSQPAFKLTDEDFLEFSQRQFYNLKIQFYDIDRNSTTDLVFTATDIQTNVTDLHFISNKNQSGLDLGGQSVADIDFVVFYDDNLLITDVDADNRPDILAGRNDALELWRNVGTGQFTFALENGDFLGLSSIGSQYVSCVISDLDADGRNDIAFGDQFGKIKIISDFKSAGSSPEIISEIVYNPVVTAYSEQNLGGRIWPAVANLFDTDKHAIVAGNILGGIQILRHDDGESVPDNPVISVYPNPWQETKVLKVKVDRHATVQVISIMGQQLNSPIALEAHELYDYDVPPLAKGIYLLKFTIDKKSFTRRLVIL